jgi:hypothetical protein
MPLIVPCLIAETENQVMNDYLAGWRRKTSVLTLGIALLFSIGWVRSFNVRDIYSFTRNDSMITFRSFEGGLGWQRFSPVGSLASTGWRSDYQFKFAVSDPWWRFDNFEDADLEWRWDWAEFSFGSAAKKDPPILRNLRLWIIPYWALVTPLVLISAYLLLTKQRPLTPKSCQKIEETSEGP